MPEDNEVSLQIRERKKENVTQEYLMILFVLRLKSSQMFSIMQRLRDITHLCDFVWGGDLAMNIEKKESHIKIVHPQSKADVGKGWIISIKYYYVYI